MIDRHSRPSCLSHSQVLLLTSLPTIHGDQLLLPKLSPMVCPTPLIPKVTSSGVVRTGPLEKRMQRARDGSTIEITEVSLYSVLPIQDLNADMIIHRPTSLWRRHVLAFCHSSSRGRIILLCCRQHPHLHENSWVWPRWWNRLPRTRKGRPRRSWWTSKLSECSCRWTWWATRWL